MKLFAVFLCAALFTRAMPFLEAQNRMPGDARALLDHAQSRMEKAFDGEITEEDEYYLGRAVAANILAAYRPYTANQALTRYVNMICRTIVANSLYPVSFNGYYVIILDSPGRNAFATPGGHIFITKGLAAAAASEDMLAAVIAHELAHIMLKHSRSVIEDVRFNKEAKGLADLAAQFSGASAAAVRAAEFRASVSGILDTFFKTGYSHGQEFEADSGAAALLSAAGYEPRALIQMLNVLRQTQKSGGINETHPSPDERIEQVAKEIRGYRAVETQQARARRFIRDR